MRHGRGRGLLREAQTLHYYNTVDHGMDNDGNLAAQPDPNRVSPFALDVEMPSSVDAIGGRMALGRTRGRALKDRHRRA